MIQHFGCASVSWFQVSFDVLIRFSENKIPLKYTPEKYDFTFARFYFCHREMRAKSTVPLIAFPSNICVSASVQCVPNGIRMLWSSIVTQMCTAFSEEAKSMIKNLNPFEIHNGKETDYKWDFIRGRRNILFVAGNVLFKNRLSKCRQAFHSSFSTALLFWGLRMNKQRCFHTPFLHSKHFTVYHRRPG